MKLWRPDAKFIFTFLYARLFNFLSFFSLPVKVELVSDSENYSHDKLPSD